MRVTLRCCGCRILGTKTPLPSWELFRMLLPLPWRSALSNTQLRHFQSFSYTSMRPTITVGRNMSTRWPVASTSTLRLLNRHDVQRLKDTLCNNKENDSRSASIQSPYFGDDTSAYATDWTKQYAYKSSNSDSNSNSSDNQSGITVVTPSTVNDVAAVLRYCHDESIAVVPVAGNTSLVGGSVPIVLSPVPPLPVVNTKQEQSGQEERHALVLSTRRLNRIYGLDSTTGILYCEAGCTLQSLHDYLQQQPSQEQLQQQEHSPVLRFQLPIDLAPRGTCCIGGTIATNAGGPYYTRYGSLAANVTGLQVVTGRGEILALNYKIQSMASADDASNQKAVTLTTATDVRHDSTGPTPVAASLHVSNAKDNTGYKLHQLFIGSEGTLGVVTHVAIQCHAYNAVSVSSSAYSPRRHVALLACHSYTQVLDAIQVARTTLGEVLSAAEWMDGTTMSLVTQRFADSAQNPLLNVCDDPKSCYPHYLLIETQGTVAEHDVAKLETFMTAILDDSSPRATTESSTMSSVPVVNGVLASSEHQADALWRLRELANPAAAATGYTYKYDVSIPGSNFADLIVELQQRLVDHDVEVVTHENYRYDTDPQTSSTINRRTRIAQTNWGHILDGNLHMNFTEIGIFERNEGIVSILEHYLYEAVLRRGGSISAEHGIGQAKTRYMDRIHSAAVLATMRAVKQVFDPKGIMNPGKVLPLPS